MQYKPRLSPASARLFEICLPPPCGVARGVGEREVWSIEGQVRIEVRVGVQRVFPPCPQEPGLRQQTCARGALSIGAPAGRLEVIELRKGSPHVPEAGLPEPQTEIHVVVGNGQRLVEAADG